MSLREEIGEQPAVLAHLLRTQEETVREVARAVRGRAVHWVLIAARGSSDHAALYAQYLWGSRNGLPVAMATPSLYTLYESPPRLQGALVVGISQSGQSPDIVRVLAEGRKQGALTLAITNDPRSALAAEACLVLDTGAGPELAIAATKTYSSQLLAVAMLSAALTGDEGQVAAALGSEPLRQIPALVESALADEAAIAQAARHYEAMARCVVLGRGYHYATASEWALKLEELTYVVAEAYSTADFRHGPVAMASSGFPVLAVVPGGAAYADVMALLAALVAERDVDLLVASDRDEALALGSTAVRLPGGLPEWLAPIVNIVPLQLWTYHLALAMGRDTEAPRGLSKVTRTW
ncbi:MAG TPA: SIS domain-containing protein [Thermoanaerobaculia bacterium]|jgi:glucosamine--fructose-6-phosphate aminotransferase (isomerizing)|nr:SIS domain-containing protein [Thermoanaerobaculia bacterium]